MHSLSLAFIGLVLATGCAIAPPAPPVLEGCQPVHAAGHEATGFGPLRLERVVCHGWRSSPFTRSDPKVSPDGSGVAATGHGTGLFLAPAEAGSLVTTLTEETGGASPFNSPFSHDDDFAWRDDSRGLWTSRQERMQPTGGWALGPVRPVFVQRSGEVARLPDLTHASGPLDALMWLGDRGIALAQFGTRGAYYRPEHADPAPTLAFVDAARGQVLDTLAYSDFPSLGLPNANYQTSGVILPDGRARALLTFNNRWVVWTANAPPRSFAAP